MDEQIIKLLKQTKDRRMYERYQTIQLHMSGYRIKDIATIIGRTEKTVGQYIQAYKANGIEGLTLRHSTGARPRLTLEQQKQFKNAIISNTPHQLGFMAKYSWTLRLMGEYIRREFGPSYSLQGVANLAHRLNLSYTKPTYTLAAADVEKQEEFTKVRFPMLKKN